VNKAALMNSAKLNFYRIKPHVSNPEKRNFSELTYEPNPANFNNNVGECDRGSIRNRSIDPISTLTTHTGTG
jgi:hypothetical protein